MRVNSITNPTSIVLLPIIRLRDAKDEVDAEAADLMASC